MSDDSIGEPFDSRMPNRRMQKLNCMRATRFKKKSSGTIKVGGVHRRRNKRRKW